MAGDVNIGRTIKTRTITLNWKQHCLYNSNLNIQLIHSWHLVTRQILPQVTARMRNFAHFLLMYISDPHNLITCTKSSNTPLEVFVQSPTLHCILPSVVYGSLLPPKKLTGKLDSAINNYTQSH